MNDPDLEKYSTGNRWFQLLQWKYAIGLESLGLRHSSRRSIRAHAARNLGLEPGTKASLVVDRINEILEKIQRSR